MKRRTKLIPVRQFTEFSVQSVLRKIFKRSVLLATDCSSWFARAHSPTLRQLFRSYSPFILLGTAHLFSERLKLKVELLETAADRM